jgi:formylglycine-generating enzyme required for sulfatase activity
VMEWLDGCDLTAHMSKIPRGCLLEAEALEYINRTAEALEHVHAQGLLHRDIKPANIMRCNDGRIKLIDFGLAKQFDPTLTYRNTGCLTEGYAPIEQYERRGKFTNALDVYALAATLYYLLTGKNPLSAEMRSGGVYKLEPPQTLNPSLSPAVNSAVMRGMEFEPADRPQEVSDFRRLLKKALIQLPAQPKLETFSFNIAQLQIKKSPSGEAEAVIVKKTVGQAKRFIEDLGNGVKLEMVAVPGGEFMMGAPDNEEDYEGNGNIERPQHLVKVTSFYMGMHPVTQIQYEALIGENPSEFKGQNLPVGNISWKDAQDFCQRLTKKSKWQYGLPSEAQWEYACRAGTTTPFYFGETISTDVANFHGGSVYGDGVNGKYLEKPTLVGSFGLANSFGLYDMHGNVWELCEDGWHTDYEGAPTNDSVWVNEKGKRYVVRGGSWESPAWHCRSAHRSDDNWVAQGDYSNYCKIGFRVVCRAPGFSIAMPSEPRSV